MITTQKSPFESKLESLITRCYIEAYCYELLKITIALNITAIHARIAVNLFKGDLSLLENSSLWFFTTASITSFLAILWTQQQTKFAYEERLEWEQAIAVIKRVGSKLAKLS